ncbi:hypothetical protein [Mesorhizobium sp. CAU 1741]|uniref:hypothetical protein n=1 Tax=Mesorhizobium sp. CAU 1741 TaxID=3140366 RepID=UPI00325B47CE
MALVEETVVQTTPMDDTRSYVDWPAIFAGAAVAAAISLVLLTFGSALGLSLTSAHEGESLSLYWIAIIGGLWLLWVQVSASIAGGYLAGRMRRRHGDATEHESDIRDGSHGLVVWAVATLVAAFLTYSSALGAASAIGQTVGSATSAVAEATDILDANEILIDRTLRSAGQGEALDDGTRAEVGRILVSSVTSDEGMTEADRQYLTALVADRAGISPEEAETRIDEIVAQAGELEQQAREAADQARKSAMIAAFLAAAALVVSAGAAYFGATLGGNHRDKQTVIEGWYRPW